MSSTGITAPSAGEWSAEDFPSPSRLNRKTNFVGTDTDIGSISRKYPGMVVYCTTSTPGSEFAADTLYVRSSFDTWLPAGLRKHLHNTTADTDGGLLSDVWIAGLENTYLLNRIDLHASNFYQSNVGGTVADDYDNGRTVLNTGVLSGQYSTVRSGGLAIACNQIIKMKLKMFMDQNTYVTTFVGPGMERADSPNDTVPKFGITACDTIGTPRNFETASCDGITRSTQTTTEIAKQTIPRVYTMIHTPGTSEQFYVNGVLNWTKSTAVPSAAVIPANNTFTASTRTNSTTPINTYLYSLMIAGVVGDTNWNV